MIAASGLMDQRDGHCGPREVVGGEYKQTLVEEINVHVLFCFSFRTTRTRGARLPTRTGLFTSLLKHTNFEE